VSELHVEMGDADHEANDNESIGSAVEASLKSKRRNRTKGYLVNRTIVNKLEREYHELILTQAREEAAVSTYGSRDVDDNTLAHLTTELAKHEKELKLAKEVLKSETEEEFRLLLLGIVLRMLRCFITS
jgi:hypothetical protein